MSEVEPVLVVEVVLMANTEPLVYGIEVGGVRLPVAYRSRSEALRIAERAYSLLVEGHEDRWAIMLASPRRNRGMGQPVESDVERIMRERESPGVPL